MLRRTFLKQSLFATLLLSAATTAFASAVGGSRFVRHNQYPDTSSISSSQSVTQSTASSATPTTDSKPSPVNAGWSPAANGSMGATRPQVRAESVQAERSGMIPALNAEYPPSADTIARNRTLFQQAQQTQQASQTNYLAGIAAR
jgi:hypothetical protein